MVIKRLVYFVFVFLCCQVDAQIFTWENPNLPKDSIIKKDSILAAKLNQDFFSRDTLDFVTVQKPIVYDEEILAKNINNNNILGSLNAKGSIVRGITFGNNQGSSVQSSMDMQISGRLSDNISILASLSDHNLPIQADGYTQSLQEFDKIYIQLNIKNHTILRAGHLDLDNTTSFFSKYQRRSMGLQAQTFWEKNGNRTDAMISMGVARSEFFRMRFQGIEGNQGPYRLTGKNGELFITIISGSEQVYIDGVLLKRGENQDYTINYNTGEITFTSFRPIHRENFITISYNYTNRNYSRYLVTGSVAHQRERFKIQMDAFVESDAKNAPLSLNLSDEDVEALKNAGNNPDAMYAPSGEITEYDVNKILYKKVTDALGTHYEYSGDKNETLYQVSFTYFGENNGDYRLQQSTTNGRVFEYVGNNLGDYRAVKRLVAPTSTQVYSIASEYELNQGKVGADISLSNYDANLFSEKGNNKNFGYAWRFYGSKKFTKGNWEGTPLFEYQRIDKNFNILNRINNVDFWRDFNLENEFSQRTQNRIIFSFLNQWKNSSLNYQFNYLDEKNNYKGIKNDLDFGWKNENWLTEAKFSYLNTEATDINSKFIRGEGRIEKLGLRGSWAIGGSMEDNQKKYNLLNQTDPTSYRWKEIYLEKKIADSTRQFLLAQLYYRDNDSVRNNRLVNVNKILGLKAATELIKNDNTQLSMQLHYRRFFYQNDDSQKDNENFVIGNITYTQKFFNNGIRLQAFYELGTGQEAQREFQYIKVTDGQGLYKWTDYNGDGIQQLDEFEIAEYADEAQYIRIYTNTVDYLPSNKNKLQAALYVNPSVIFDSRNAFLKRWNFNVSVLSQNSYLKKDKVLEWNPFHSEDNQILKIQNLLFSAQFNPTDQSGWNASYKFADTQNLINANYSVENNIRKNHTINLGYAFNRNLRADWSNQLGEIVNSSQMFSSRNYTLNKIETRPKITYNFSQAIQASLEFSYKNLNRADGEEQLKTGEITGGLQWERSKTSIRANLSFINNDFSGNSFSIVGNQMLEGLKAGKNQVWSILFQQSINSFLNLNINYEGRNSGERTIHVGSVQVRASF